MDKPKKRCKAPAGVVHARRRAITSADRRRKERERLETWMRHRPPGY